MWVLGRVLVEFRKSIKSASWRLVNKRFVGICGLMHHNNGPKEGNTPWKQWCRLGLKPKITFEPPLEMHSEATLALALSLALATAIAISSCLAKKKGIREFNLALKVEWNYQMPLSVCVLYVALLGESLVIDLKLRQLLWRGSRTKNILKLAVGVISRDITSMSHGTDLCNYVVIFRLNWSMIRVVIIIIIIIINSTWNPYDSSRVTWGKEKWCVS